MYTCVSHDSSSPCMFPISLPSFREFLDSTFDPKFHCFLPYVRGYFTQVWDFLISSFHFRNNAVFLHFLFPAASIFKYHHHVFSIKLSTLWSLSLLKSLKKDLVHFQNGCFRNVVWNVCMRKTVFVVFWFQWLWLSSYEGTFLQKRRGSFRLSLCNSSTNNDTYNWPLS